MKNRKGRQQEQVGDLNGYHSELNNDGSLSSYDTNEFVNVNHPSINIGELDTQLASKTAKPIATGIVCFDTISKFFAGVICLVIAMVFLVGGEIVGLLPFTVGIVFLASDGWKIYTLKKTTDKNSNE